MEQGKGWEWDVQKFNGVVLWYFGMFKSYHFLKFKFWYHFHRLKIFMRKRCHVLVFIKYPERHFLKLKRIKKGAIGAVPPDCTFTFCRSENFLVYQTWLKFVILFVQRIHEIAEI